MTALTVDPPTLGWARVQLTGPGDPNNPCAPRAEGELLLRADRVSVSDGTLFFLRDDQVVFELDRRYLKSIAWLDKAPSFAGQPNAQHANSTNQHRRWSPQEQQSLLAEVAQGLGWRQIADLHGRGEEAVRLRALHLARCAQAAVAKGRRWP